MAGITKPDYLTLTDVAAATHNQELVAMADAIGKSTTLLDAMPWRQSSDALRDVTGKVTKYPEAQWVGLDLGVKASKGKWTQVEEGLAMLESWSEINEKTYAVSPNKEQMRWLNDELHIKQMAMEAEKGLIYGNPLNGTQQMLGFMPRFNKVTDFERVAGGVKYDYCTLSCGGTTANIQSSILMIAKGGMAPYLLYPRYKENNGLVFRHFDFENDKDELGGNVRTAKSQFQMTLGLSIADPRTVVRIANIETVDSTIVANVRDALFEGFAAIPREYRDSIELYAPAKVILELRKNYANLVNPVTYDASGKGKNAYGDIMFDGHIIHECNSMLNTEDVVA